MWSPTHIQVTVHRARGLLTKGKNGKNNCYVTIALGKEKFMTTLIKDADPNLEWHELCELAIPDKGNRAELVLTCLHQNPFGLDDFLGQCTLPLNEMDVYDQPRSRWYQLQSKPGKEKKKERGELEIRIGFTVKAEDPASSAKKEKHKSSLGQLASGSLLSLNTLEKRKNLKKFAKSLGSKMHITGKKKSKDGGGQGDGDSISGSVTDMRGSLGQQHSYHHRQMAGEADPGVISENEDDDEFTFDNLSHKSSGSSLNVSHPHNGQPLNGRQRGVTPPISKLASAGSPAISVRSAASSTMNEVDLRGAADDEEYRNKSMTLPIPPKPPRSAAAEQKDEWEEKLYGRNVDAVLGSNSSDSLKRRSWEPSARVPLTVPKEEAEEAEEEERERVVAVTPSRSSSTAPASPAVSEKRESVAMPQPLPRSNTLESVAEIQMPVLGSNNNSNKAKSEKKAENKENKFTKKLKYLKKEFGRNGSSAGGNLHNNNNHSNDQMTLDQQQSKLAMQRQLFHHNQFGSERIIIGHENDHLKLSSGEVPKEVALKYEGKSREEMLAVAYQMENEVRYQKQRVKELEDYLDNLLLRVMETHPKILQSPYTKMASTKSG